MERDIGGATGVVNIPLMDTTFRLKGVKRWSLLVWLYSKLLASASIGTKVREESE